MDPDREVCRADGAGPETDADLAGDLRITRGHERCAALVPGGHERDRRVVERIENAEIALAGDAEAVPNA